MTTKRIAGLDGLRGLLALYILLGHTLPFLPTGSAAALGWGVFKHGRAAVDLFFILSGMVICHSLAGLPSQGRARAFLSARAGRLLPVYFLALAPALASIALGDPFAHLGWIAAAAPAHEIVSTGWPQPFLPHLLTHLALLHGAIPAGLLPDAEFSLLGPAWSLSTEWQFYLLLTLLLVWRRPTEGWLAGGLLVLAALGTALPLLPAGWQFGRAFLPVEAGYFALGVASDAWLRGRPGGWRLLALALLGCLASAACQGGVSKLVAPCLWLACLAAAAGHGGALGGLLGHRALRGLGAISYPLYLIHAPIQRGLLVGLGAWAQGDGAAFAWAWLPSALLLPLAAAWAVHRWVEEPARLWERRWRQARAVRAAASGSSRKAPAPPPGPSPRSASAASHRAVP